MKSGQTYNLKLLALAAALVMPENVRAQTVDYGSLQSLFGEPVTTSATGTPQRVSDVPTNMTIITADEIRQSGSRNIPEIISRVPGMDILRQSVSTFDVGVRGYQQPFQPRLLVLVDGRQVFIEDYSRTIWDNIPVNVDDIRQIEVVKGASSALFGSNAAGGVINIVTYSPLYDNNNVANFTAGTQHTWEGDATVTRNGSWGGTKFSAGGMTGSEFKTERIMGDQIPVFSPKREYAVNSSVFQLNPDFQVNTEATYARNSTNDVDGISYITTAQNTTTYSGRAGFNWQSPYGLITSNTYYNHSYVNFYEVSDGGEPYGLTLGLFVSQLQDQFKIGTDDTFRAALEYRNRTSRITGNALEQQDPKLNENIYTTSGTWVHQFNDKLSWTNAIRFDHLQMDQIGTLADGVASTDADYGHAINTWSANSDVVYKATDLDTFRIGYGRGVQLPSLLQSDFNVVYSFAGFPGDFEGNPKLNPTVVQDVSFDYSRKIPSLDSTLKLSPYYETNQDITAPLQFIDTPQLINGTVYPLLTSINVGDSHGWGGEIQLKGSNPAGFRWDGSYSYSRIVDDPHVLSTIDYQGSAPQHHLRFLLGYTTGPWEFDAKSQYLSSTNMLRSFNGGLSGTPISVDGYYSLSARAGYKINDQFTLALSGTNLSQVTTRENVYPDIERQVFLSLTGKF